MSHLLFRDIHEWFMNKFNERSRMFINFLFHGLVEFMVVHELALLHELSEFMTVHEQPMVMNKVRVHEQNKFLNSWTSMKVSFVVQKYSWTVQEHVCERSRTFIVFNQRTDMSYFKYCQISPEYPKGQM